MRCQGERDKRSRHNEGDGETRRAVRQKKEAASRAGRLFCFFAFPAETENEREGARIGSALQLVVSLGFLGAWVLPNFVPPRPWLWTYNTVVLWIGSLNTCMLPASIPLLKNWHKLETKKYFGKS